MPENRSNGKVKSPPPQDNYLLNPQVTASLPIYITPYSLSTTTTTTTSNSQVCVIGGRVGSHGLVSTLWTRIYLIMNDLDYGEAGARKQRS